MKNQITLTPDFVYEEDTALSEIKPGMLIDKATVGGNVGMKPHADEGAQAIRAFATEDALQGKTKANSYATGARVSYAIVPRGGKVRALLLAGESVVVGKKLMSAGHHGPGRLMAGGGGSGSSIEVIGQSEEVLNLTGSGAVDTLIVIRVW